MIRSDFCVRAISGSDPNVYQLFSSIKDRVEKEAFISVWSGVHLKKLINISHAARTFLNARSDNFPTLTNCELIIHRLRGDLNESFDLDTESGLGGFRSWLDYRGVKEIPSCAQADIEQEAYRSVWSSINLKKSATISAEANAFLSINSERYSLFTNREVIVHEIRPDLRQSFDLNLDAGQSGYRAWLDTRGAAEIPLKLRAVTDSSQFLQADEYGVDLLSLLGRLLGVESQSSAMDQALEQLRGPLRQWLLVTNDRVEAEANLAIWFGLKLARNVALSQHAAKYLCLKVVQMPGLLNWQLILYKLDSELHKEYDLGTKEGISQYSQWLGDARIAEDFSALLTNRSQVVSREYGVNIIGLGNRTLGIGEDVRCVVKCLELAEIPFCVINYPEESSSDKNDELNSDYIRAELIYNISIFVMPVNEVLRFFLEKESLVKGQYNIAYSPWELPYMPEEHLAVFNVVDELWCSSQYIQSGVPSKFQNRTVLLPLSFNFTQLSQSATVKKNRAFSFLFIFDSLSFPSRKNPQVVINAFKQAFGQNSDVKLTIKTMHLERISAKVSREISAMVKDVQNINLIDSVYGKQQLVDLIASHHIFVSAHRAEGFGRLLPEVMHLKVPCIVSNFSGNTDYCSEDNCIFLDGHLVPVGDEYQFSDDRQYWFDADLNDLSEKMSLSMNQYDDCKKKAEQAKMDTERLGIENMYPELARQVDRIQKTVFGLPSAGSRLT